MNNLFYRLLLLGLVILSFYACKVTPKPINYGEDHCYNCDMTVVSKTHAAEFVTKKGKSYMFDAAECMVWKLNKNENENDMEFLLVSDFANPGELVNALQATYLISDKIQSPMGANLTAFKSKEAATNALKEHGGKLFTWVALKSELGKGMKNHEKGMHKH